MGVADADGGGFGVVDSRGVDLHVRLQHRALLRGGGRKVPDLHGQHGRQRRAREPAPARAALQHGPHGVYRPGKHTGRNQVEHPPAGAEDTAEREQRFGQRQRKARHAPGDAVAERERRQKRTGCSHRPVAPPPAAHGGRAAQARGGGQDQRGGQQRQHAEAQIVEAVILAGLLRQHGQQAAPGITAAGGGVPQRVGVHGKFAVAAARKPAARADGPAQHAAQHGGGHGGQEIKRRAAPGMGDAAALDSGQQRADHDRRQKIRVDAHRRKAEDGEPPGPGPGPAAAAQRGALFQKRIQCKQKQPLRGQRHMAERTLPQSGQAGEQRAGQKRPHSQRRAAARAARAQQRPGRPLQRKAEQRVQAKPLEGGGQHAAQQLEEDADPGQAVGVRDRGAVGRGDCIGKAEREGPVAVAEQKPARIVLLDIPFVIAV